MAPQLFHLEGPSLEDLKSRASILYGPRALIVSAEVVTVGGIRGVLARKHYEIVVEVPERADEPASGGRPRGRRSTGSQPVGLDALLQQAELDEVRLAGGDGAPRPARRRASAGPVDRPQHEGVTAAPELSTDSGLFAALMDNLTFATGSVGSSGDLGPVPGTGLPRMDQPVPGTVPPTTAVPLPLPAAVPVPAAVSGHEIAPALSAVPPPAIGAQMAAPTRAATPSRPATAAILFETSRGTAPDGPKGGEEDAAPPRIPYLAVDAADPSMLPELAGPVLAPSQVEDTVPAVLRAPGDLVVVVGATAPGWEIALSMAAAFAGGVPAAVASAGRSGWFSPDARRVQDRLDAGVARAAGVDGGHAVFLALFSEDAVSDSSLLLALRPDQIWLAVDAGRKEADTAAWVGRLTRSMERAGLAPTGLAVVGSSTTTTPDTVTALGLPVGWSDGRPAERAPGHRPHHAPRGRRRAGHPGIG
ncbi:hypothetical protein FJV46_10055 [Arthrobacter agilis]|uniref:hypothetical protein n=1 Tax=Arthrobacter agilis TaxID=37921 RepID=UPI000B351924|nr:hypothetical protein [Arthrobacter agilis]OUM43752.1 hypothetical protein B8W74_06305 [Arthrobacter agilis]PPB46662.1 hypothetical protein CI784_05085 [Arthrobacter agilis]TPV24994.1 hypothetical protein FJV46_10055 [Arthrobacter agilis]VDR31174.1 Uncharacterised protein [Arthrobacter agilis]